MKNKRVVVTGGAGFIGFHLAEELAKNNEVIIIDNLSTGKIENVQHLLELDNVSFIKGNVRDSMLLKKLFENVDYVFDQAAIPSVPKSIENPSLVNASSPYAAVIPKFIKRIKENKPPIIYGDGKQTRDFIYVKDVVKAEKNVTGVFNIASGKQISINELANLIMKNNEEKTKANL